jgi:ATP-dependent DNA helicase RecG
LFNGIEVPYSVNGKYYTRVSDESREMTQSQLRDLFEYSNIFNREWESKPSSSTFLEVNDKILSDYYNDGYLKGRIIEKYSDSKTALTKFGLLSGDYLTNAGQLLFGISEPIWLKMAIFATEQKITIIDMVQFHGNIFECIEAATKYIIHNIRWKIDIDAFKRTDIPEIPVRAIREIILNSFEHSSYRNSNIAHEINIFPTKITIFNPGSLPSEIEPYAFAKENKNSFFRNPKIADILFRCSQIEAFGTGFKRAFSLLDDYEVKYEYINSQDGFTFVFFRKSPFLEKDSTQSDVHNLENVRNVDEDDVHNLENVRNVDEDDVHNLKNVRNVDEVSYLGNLQMEINDFEMELLTLLERNPYLKNDEISELLFKSEKTIYRYLTHLKDSKYLERVGNQKTGYWKILKS